ncbi:glycosyltransferase family 4 protein [Pontibacter sp. G13]|uniref:glycosyltransferase family 4 protein n=1 Tax=Pontibacter sp. G13 TaxID=3074898 RepID=UPI00288BB485|nr:glycosyltransferase family 4 protein [Pontibacter sp. G13]WNJ19309.1 glycosyltransferase family 4 protein [Pontibacter sp. G13]
MIHVLVTAYAVNPYKGSEDGTGWNWVINLAEYSQVTVITRANNLPHIDRFRKEHPGRIPEHLAFVGFDLPQWQRFWKRGSFGALPYYLLWQRALPQFVESLGLRFDIVHSLNFHNDWTPVQTWKLGKPVVWGPIGHHPKMPEGYVKKPYGTKQWVMEEMKWGVKQFFWKWSNGLKDSVRNAEAILVMNSSVQQVLELPARKTHRMPAVGCASKPLAAKVPNPKFEVLCVGRFVPLKAPDLAIRAFTTFMARLNPRDRRQVRFTLVGKGPMQAQLQEMIHRADAGQQIELVNWMPQSELFERYRSADVFLFPSHEGAGMVIPEALSYGLPVVCFDNFGPGEFVTQTCGIRVPYTNYARSVCEFADALERLYRNPQSLDRLRIGARTRFEQWFDWRVKAQFVQQIYRQLIPSAGTDTLPPSGASQDSGNPSSIGNA